MAFFKIIVLFTLIVLTYSQTVVNKCTSGGYVPVVYLSSKNTNCTTPPCKVYPGYSAVLEINFISPSYAEKLIPTIKATALGANINWPSNQDDGCVGLQNTNCPLVTGENVDYIYEMPLLEWLPEVLVHAEFSLANDEDKQLLFCFSVDLQVTKQ